MRKISLVLAVLFSGGLFLSAQLPNPLGLPDPLGVSKSSPNPAGPRASRPEPKPEQGRRLHKWYRPKRHDKGMRLKRRKRKS
jgi:hypothetical protein